MVNCISIGGFRHFHKLITRGSNLLVFSRLVIVENSSGGEGFQTEVAGINKISFEMFGLHMVADTGSRGIRETETECAVIFAPLGLIFLDIF